MKMTKLTKNCILPWTFMQVHAGGMMQPCAVGPDTDLGDFIIDYCQPLKRGERRDVLNNPGLRALREGLLTGNLRPMCRRCFFWTDQLIPTDALQKKVRDFLQSRLPAGTDMDQVDLTRTVGLETAAITFTNRCNLRCVYCVQSTLAKSNPYLKMDFPDEYMMDALDFIAAQNPQEFRTCVEGEATIHKRWHEVFSRFKTEHPEVKLFMTTNLARKFSGEEFDLLGKYHWLDISIDTLNPELYAKIRRNGKLDLVKANLLKLAEIKRQSKDLEKVTLHAVVSSLTWREQEELADFAFALDFGYVAGNYEERANALAYQTGMMKPISTLSVNEQTEVRDMMLRIRKKAESSNRICIFQGGIFQHVNEAAENQYNRFSPYDGNPLHEAFYEAFPKGSPEAYLDIFYDYDNIAYPGISMQPGHGLNLDGLRANGLILREVQRFKPGTCSSKYGQTVLPQFRKTKLLENGKFCYASDNSNPSVERVLLCCEEYW